MPSAKPLRVASVNVNGVRAAFRRGMGEWLDGPRRRPPRHAGGARLHRRPAGAARRRVGHPARPRNREGSRRRRDREPQPGEHPPRRARRARLRQRRAMARGRLRGRRPRGHRGERLRALGRGRHPEAGREVPVPRRDGGAAARAGRALRARARGRRPQRRAPHARHPQLEGQREAGRVPARRARLLRPLRRGRGRDDYNRGGGLGWVDVGRRFAGEVDGPYTWWSWRGKAFDNDTGWRIDYQLATPALADTVVAYTVDRAATYDARLSDHAPVVVDYDI